jgi:hypothetical protein
MELDGRNFVYGIWRLEWNCSYEWKSAYGQLDCEQYILTELYWRQWHSYRKYNGDSDASFVWRWYWFQRLGYRIHYYERYAAHAKWQAI